MPLPRFTPRQLEAFISVAELHSFSAAGKELNLTPSAISQLVSELEAAIDLKLFDRSTRKVTLSAAGKEFLGPSRTVLKYLRSAAAAAVDVRDRAAGIVRVAAPLVLASMVLPKVIQAYQKTRPKVIVRIRDCAVEYLVDSVVGADADLAVGPDRVTSEGISLKPVFDSPWVVWCTPEHPLAIQKIVHWQDLHQHALVAAGRDHEHSVAQMSAGLPDHERINPIDVVDNITTALGIASQGLALTMAPAYVAALAQPLGLVMRPVIDPEVVRQVCIYRSLTRVPSPAAEGFAEYLENWLHHWSQSF